ncbi:MAG: response regulator transcription factor [Burkholderiales bacterium]|uniref:response regulator transcription factor n=1 Tax=Nitrosomonas sp. TaxID=42353 RepID=UPI001D77A233|nr:response regulator transcription factor [Nitrosomonas sp.]MCB1949585.1 response regulator transcription factor [Nitrosomonas sp.]MCP5243428.1 response regulator transcription factor [Burkholderiales bacterium]
MPTSKAQVMLVDGHAMMRQSIAILVNLESDMEVCAEAKDGREAIAALNQNRHVDIVLLAVTFRTISGFEIIKDIQSLNPALPVLFVSMNDEEIYAERALQSGARGYVMKQESGEMLISAIREVLNGNIFLSKKMYAKLLNKITIKRIDTEQLINTLTPSEFEVMNLIGQGYSSQEIAKLLERSIKTIETHRFNIRTKLNLKDSTDLIRYATRWVNGQQ